MARTRRGPGCWPETKGRTTKIETNYLARALGAAAVAVREPSAAAILRYALWWRKNPSACPYALRLFVDLPHPLINRARLREILARRPGGRLVVGEVFPDFRMVPFGAFKERAEEAGLGFERRVGGLLGYFARFRVP